MSTTATASYALTTLFTPPSSCGDVTWVSSTCPSSSCEPVYNIVRLTETECYPSGWDTTATLFSPGLVCPSGYTIADETTSSYGATKAETLATCCPRYELPTLRYDFDPDWRLTYFRPFSGYSYTTSSAETWWITEPCYMTSATTTTITYTIEGTSPTTTTTITYAYPKVHAMPVGLAWQESDLSLSTAISASASTTAASTSTSTSSSSSNSGLSTGAKAGVGVGVAVGAILIASAIGAFLYFRRKKQNSPEITYHETARDETVREEPVGELSGIPQSYPSELGGSTPMPVELAGDESQKDHTSQSGR